MTLLFVIGCCGIPSNNTGASWGAGSMLLLYNGVYDFTVSATRRVVCG